MKKTKENIRWEIGTEQRVPLSKDITIIVAIVTGCAVVISLIFDNLFFAIFLLLAGITYVLLPHSPQTRFHFELTKDGVDSTNVFYPLSNIYEFNVIDVKGELSHLILIVGGIDQKISIPIFDKDVDRIEDYFKGHEITKDGTLAVSWFERIATKL